jgi:predicted metalloprotease with PDZ domain
MQLDTSRLHNRSSLSARGIDKAQLIIEPSIILSSGWKQGSALRVSGQTDNRVNFAPVSLERLIDSPVLASEFFRIIPLTSAWRNV